jgi:lysine 2,3-aminomutase
MPDGPTHDARTLRTADALVAAGLIAPAARDAAAAVARRYAVAITPAMRALISPGNSPGIAAPDDPIARQFVPDPAELITVPHESADPIADDALSPVKGVVHRYADRALLKPLLACPDWSMW